MARVALRIIEFFSLTQNIREEAVGSRKGYILLLVTIFFLLVSFPVRFLLLISKNPKVLGACCQQTPKLRYLRLMVFLYLGVFL